MFHVEESFLSVYGEVKLQVSVSEATRLQILDPLALMPAVPALMTKDSI